MPAGPGTGNVLSPPAGRGLEATYSRVLTVENSSAVDISLPDTTTPATMAMMMAAALPIQNDFMALSLPKFVFLLPVGPL